MKRSPIDVPLTSILMATKNRVTLLERALNSALAQTYPHTEIVVVNDGSTDETRAYLDRVAREHGKLKVIHHEQSAGACRARNTALNACSGHFVTNLDDDDYIEPTRLEAFYQSYESGVSLLFSGYHFIGHGLDYLSQNPHAYIDFGLIKQKNHIGNSVFVLRDSLMALGGYDERLSAWEDYDLWFRLIQGYGPAKYVANHSYTVDMRSAQNRITGSQKAHLGYQQFVAKHADCLSPLDLKHQALNDLYDRTQRLSLRSSLAFIGHASLRRRLLMLQLRTRLPSLYSRLIRLSKHLRRRP